MAKKKRKTTKKHRFIHKEAEIDIVKKVDEKPKKGKPTNNKASDKNEVENIGYIKKDLNHFIYIAGSVILVTIILYYVSENTDVITNLFEKIDPR